MAARVLSLSGLDALIAALADRGYSVLGPTIREGAIVYGPVSALSDLPVGWTDEQEAGSYRLVERDDGAVFGYVVGPHSWKRFTFAPRETVFEVKRVDDTLKFSAADVAPQRYAFLGVRACELAALAIQDNVFLGGPYADPHYGAARRGAFVVAVNCVEPGGTCFCVSMGTGPQCRSGYDIVLTEILEDDRHEFLVESGSDAGEEVLDELPTRTAAESGRDLVRDLMARATASMGRRLDARGTRMLLSTAAEHPRWEQIAQRCLACANCTLVCPTCFCFTVEDVAGLDDAAARRERRWDSCFTFEFSSVHGVPVRASIKSRYRQWMTHKLSSWYDQFGTSGCVGCGRCITWCPVGIDITREAAAMYAGAEV